MERTLLVLQSIEIGIVAAKHAAPPTSAIGSNTGACTEHARQWWADSLDEAVRQVSSSTTEACVWGNAATRLWITRTTVSNRISRR